MSPPRARRDRCQRCERGTCVAGQQGGYAVNIKASCEFAPEPASPKLARQFVRETLHGEISEPMLHDALLVASELVTNAVVHGGTPARLEVNADEHAVTISVTDQAGTMPEVGDP